MKALTLTQPWAALVAVGAKRVETRSWRTNYRGPLAIHAAKGFPPEAREFAETKLVCSALAARPSNLSVMGLARGVVLAYVDLIDCVATERVCERLSAEELAFGNFGYGRWAWMLGEVTLVDPPIVARGALGLWEFPDLRSSVSIRVPCVPS